jgi:hypothetical protein
MTSEQYQNHKIPQGGKSGWKLNLASPRVDKLLTTAKCRCRRNDLRSASDLHRRQRDAPTESFLAVKYPQNQYLRALEQSEVHLDRDEYGDGLPVLHARPETPFLDALNRLLVETRTQWA